MFTQEKASPLPQQNGGSVTAKATPDAARQEPASDRVQDRAYDPAKPFFTDYASI